MIVNDYYVSLCISWLVIILVTDGENNPEFPELTISLWIKGKSM